MAKGPAAPPRPSKGDGEGWVALFRAANVGGHQNFTPATVAQGLPEWGVKNVGAVGTLVLGMGSSAASVRKAIASQVPFEPEMAILSGREFRLALDLAPPEVASPKDGSQGFASVLVGDARLRPKLPIVLPNAARWQLKLVATQGSFVFSTRRALEPGAFYPNAFVEKAYGAHATTRGWPTLLKVRALLDAL